MSKRGWLPSSELIVQPGPIYLVVGESLLSVSLQFFRKLGSRFAPSSSQEDGGETEGIKGSLPLGAPCHPKSQGSSGKTV